MRVIGFDQSLSVVGYAVIESDTLQLIHYGYMKFETESEYNDKRIEIIKNWIYKKIEEYNGECFALEDTQMQKNAEVFKELTKLLGVISNLFFVNKYLYIIAKPKEWKGAFKIKGRKREIQKANTQAKVLALYNVSVSEDEADAILITRYMCEKLNKKNKG